MAKTIKIQNLRHIKELVFDIPGKGVHLLAGINGAGKTSILACLRRIGHSNAFSHHFSASKHSNALDNFEDAQITYTHTGRTVTYAYGGERWVPRPRSQNQLLSTFGYPTVLYIGATADRITPRPEDFNVRRIALAPEGIRSAANKIFGTNKFDNLKTINLTRGAGNSAFLLQASPPPRAKYFSERNFSLGELCILKLLKELINCPDNSLILIDELELALHPKAQIELLDYLSQMADQKNLTVIFSTHSVSLLKRVERRKILFLENINGVITTLKGCFPTYALGMIAYEEERVPDVVIYVEDEAALHVTELLVRMCISVRFSSGPAHFPTIQIIPIGAFINVVRFLARSHALLPASTSVSALLDQDVKAESVVDWQTNKKYAVLDEFQQNEGKINYLPWTPEVGFIEYLNNPSANALNSIRMHFGNSQITIRNQDIGVIPNIRGGEQRKACKAAVDRIIEHLRLFLPNWNYSQVKKDLFGIFAKWYFENNRAAAMSLFGPLIAGI